MPNFILTYRSAKSYDALTDPDSLAAWGAFLNEVIAPNVVDPGFPVFEPSTVVGDAGPSTRLGGYSIVTADDLETALAMAKELPDHRAWRRRRGRNPCFPPRGAPRGTDALATRPA